MVRHRQTYLVDPVSVPAVDRRPGALRAAVSQLRRALAGYGAHLPDREAAEEQLASLDLMAAAGVPDPAALRQALLLVLAALGSVSALADPLAELRTAIGDFASPSADS